MTLIQVLDRYVEYLTFPPQRIPLILITFSVLIIILRSFDLINTLEEIDRQQSESRTERQIDYRQQTESEKIDSSRLSEYNFPPEIVDKKSHLKVSMACFVRYCVKNELFKPYTKQGWTPIDGLIYSKTSKLISAKQLAQSYQDLLTKGTLDE